MAEAYIVGGPNGAGKSTLAYGLQDDLGYTYLSADRIAHELNPSDPLSARVSAGRTFYKRLQATIEAAENFIVESTLAGQSMGRVLTQLNRKSYSTRIAFVFLDSPELCIRRVKERTRRGGHDVPKEDIIRRFYRSKNNFWSTYRYQVDSWFLLYNAVDNFQDVASGESDRVNVMDEELLTLVLRDVSST